MSPNSHRFFLLLTYSLLTLAGCNFNQSPPHRGATPTIIEIPPTTTSISEILPTTQSSPTVQIPVIETPTSTSAAPIVELTPTNTQGPYEHTIEVGDSLITVIQRYNYTDFTISPGTIIDQIVRINDNIPDADTLPGPGSVILIPRQTATTTPASTEPAVLAATNAAPAPIVQFSENATLTEYTVQAGDTIISIAQENNLTLEQIAVLNTDLNVFGCNFEIPSGGPNCNIPLQVGQLLQLPAPTPTPTLSPTPSGNETPTPTPTYSAPALVYPPEGASAAPGIFSLQWVGVGILQPHEYYLIEIIDTTINRTPYRQVTKNTSLLLPDALIPTDGQAHTFNWTVRVVTPNEQGIYRVISGESEIHTFNWQSR